MTYQNIYDYALSLLGETADSAGMDDYLARAPLLLAGIVSRLSELSHMLAPDSPIIAPAASVTLGDDFALDARLMHPAGLMLASELIFDEQPELSASLGERAKSELSRLSGSATTVGSIREVYE